MNEFDAACYTISVRKEDTEDGRLFVARVAELPDVAVYEESMGEAYEEIMEVIATSKEMFDEDGQPFPEPNVEEDRQYSGRVPLRVPVILHAGLVRQAEQNNVSLNQWCVHLLSAQTTIASIESFIRMSPSTSVVNRWDASTEVITLSLDEPLHKDSSNVHLIPLGGRGNLSVVQYMPAQQSSVYRIADEENRCSTQRNTY